jgi:hypothetical protein
MRFCCWQNSHILQRGTHYDLLARGGQYARLFAHHQDEVTTVGVADAPGVHEIRFVVLPGQVGGELVQTAVHTFPILRAACAVRPLPAQVETEETAVAASAGKARPRPVSVISGDSLWG